MRKEQTRVLLTAAVLACASISPILANAGTKTVTTINGKDYFLTGSNVEISTWRDGAVAAYSAIHDDMGADNAQGINWHMDTVLYNRGLIGTPGVITSSCNITDVNDMKRQLKHGHELMSHSKFHGGAQSNWNADEEIINSKKWLDSTLNINTGFFIFPFDQWTPLAIQQLKNAGYLGARSGDRQVITDSCKHAGIDPHYHNAYDFADPFDLVFDVYGEKHSGYKYMKTRAGGDDKHYFMKAHVAAAINNNGWSIREFHGIEDASWESIPLADYQSWMDFIKTKVDANKLWMDGPTRIIKYRFTREYAGTPSLTSSAGGYNLSFGTSSNAAELAKYNTAITVFVKTTGISQYIKATQGGITLPTKKVSNNYYSVNVNPTLGQVAIEESSFPYVKVPSLSDLDTVASSYPQWFADEVYPGNDTVFYEGKEYRNKYWTQANNPATGTDWVLLNDVSNVRAVNSRAVLFGTVSPEGKQLIGKTTATTIAVTPNSGFQIDSVIVNGVNKGALTTVVIPGDSKAYAIDAYFGYPNNVEMLTVNATAGTNGTISPNGSNGFAKGSSPVFAIKPDFGFLLDMITLNGVSNAAVSADTLYTISNLSQNSTLNATFKENPVATYLVTAAAGANGSITPAEAAVTAGSNVNYVITPAATYLVDSILVDGIYQGNVTPFTLENVVKNQAVRVVFKAAPVANFNVTAVAGANGTITPADTTVASGSNVTYVITPAADYAVDSILVDGVYQGTVTPFTLENIAANQVVRVVFKSAANPGIPAWDANTPWNDYSVGTKRTDNGSVYECIAPAYSTYQPSGPHGHYGWKKIN